MCGIVGYVGKDPACDILLAGLKKLEYRGYDSAGIALLEGSTSTSKGRANTTAAAGGNENASAPSASANTTSTSSTSAGNIDVLKRAGKVEELEKALQKSSNEAILQATCGIGHTRWATHGQPSEANAHPQCDCTGKISLVHNGIIENFTQLRDELQADGHKFVSDTDTEVIAHLLEKHYKGDLVQALAEVTKLFSGAYALAAMHVDNPGQIVVTRKDSPVVVGYSKEKSAAFVASDVVALIEYTRDVIFLEDGQIALLSQDGISYFDAQTKPITPKITHVDWDIEDAEKGGYPDFMLKEIFEQPRAVRDTIAGKVKNGRVLLDEFNLDEDDIEAIDTVSIIGCGTSYHAALVARELIERWARIPTIVEVASEFRYRNPIVSSSTLVIAVSQSGETADTLAAVRLARSKGARVFAVTNCVGSRITRESDATLYVKANMEIAVAATKSFLAQIACLALIAMFLGQKKQRLTTRQVNSLYYELRETPAMIEDILQDADVVEPAAKILEHAHSALYVGRGIASTVCAEGALKLKELSYLHAESYSAGEMKHGPIALLDDKTPVVAVVTDSPTRAQTVSNIAEAKTRNSPIIALASEGDTEVEKLADCTIFIPKARDWCSAITASVPLQLLARFVALERGCNVDKPRNLAKSVTVE